MVELTNQQEVDRNYEAFRKLLPELSKTIPGKFVVMHRRKMVKTFDSFPEAAKYGYGAYGRGKFSVQEVTDRVISLGAQSYALSQPSD